MYLVPKTQPKLDSIQVLRAVAVVLVVYYHSINSAVQQFGTSTQSSFFFLSEWGAIGVDLFFVISGFIMTRILGSYQRPDGWKTFALKRAIRILPLYWGLSLLATLWILRKYVIEPAVVWKMIAFIPVWETDFVFPVIPAGWSLSYELYFYLLIVLVLRLGLQRPQLVLILLLVFLSGIGVFVYSPAMLPRFLFSPLLFEFALGIGCGLVYDRVQPGSRWYRAGLFAVFFTGLLFIVAPVFFKYSDLDNAYRVLNNNQLAFRRCVVWGIPSALFILGSLLIEREYSLTFPPLLLRVGDASYSNYLLHVLIILFGRKTLVNLHLLSADGYILCLLTGSTVLSLLLYRFVEKPVTDWINRFFFPRKQPSGIRTSV